jgi:hypothetical protein
MSTSTPGTPTTAGLSPSSTEVLAATIAGAVERQLTQYVTAMAQQVDAVRQAAEADKHALRAEFQQRLDEVVANLSVGQQQSDSQQHALQSVLEERLGEFSRHQQLRLNEVENRILETGGGSFDSGEIIALREQIDSQSAAAHARIDELHKATRRFDEQAAAMVQHVNDTTIALTQRMDEGNHALASAVEERLGFVRTTLESVGPEVQRQLAEHATLMNQRLDFTEHKVTDRMLAMEERVNETNGTKIARLEATVGRIGAGFDEAMAALSQRMLELENKMFESTDQLKVLAAQVNTIDDKAIAAVKEQLSAAVGEAMLVRIELDRVVASTDEKIGKNSLRMAEIEALLADELDVSASVQLERLEELERAFVALDPNQFVRKTDPGVNGAAYTPANHATAPAAVPAAAAPRRPRPCPARHSLPRCRRAAPPTPRSRACRRSDDSSRDT